MGITERKLREKEKRKVTIIDAAEKIFFEQGFIEATMDEIANQAELSKGTLYTYFKNKEELFIAIAERAGQIFHEEALASICDKQSGYDKFRAILDSNTQCYFKYPNYFKLIALSNKYIGSLIKGPESIERLKKIEEHFYIEMLKAVESGIQDKTMSYVDNAMSYVMIISILQHQLLSFLAENGEMLKLMYNYEEQEIIDYANKIFFGEIAPPKK